ncbi:MAG: hypothetical protein DUD27_00990 [Lachnospiraceae bacterium]|uniref:DUF4097 domain-containing protein n=1 Tax=Candidatus Weimeria bifida TaxID=2599074 RepID=A0A6N7IYU2_9FIRM|nr:DUF4097 domain-containing protein [Candidatus Weimeria bifida]RRF97166.1 MAG: hypothetical protein DUD27_00990 [Lachnospiraceae bacterium]
MKKRSIYLILLGIITIAGICYGTYLHIGKPLLNASGNYFSYNLGSKGNHKTLKKINVFSTAQISLHNADVAFISGDDYSLTYVGKESILPTYKVENGVLTVKDPATGKKPSGVLKVTIPDSLTELNEINVAAYTGDTCFGTKQKLAVNTISINSQDGDIVFGADKDLNVDTLTLNSKNGDIVFKSSDSMTADTATLYTENGDMTVSGADFNDSKMTSKSGDIIASNVSFKKSEVTSTNGDIRISTSDDLSSYTFNLNGGNGDISIGDGLYKGTLSYGSDITVGKGSNVMILSTKNGDVTVKK